MIRFPFRKTLRLVVVLYTVLLAVVLVFWKTSGTYPFEGKRVALTYQPVPSNEHPGTLETLFVPDSDTAIINMAQAQGQKDCTVKKIVSFMKRKVLLNQDPVCGWLQSVSEESDGNFLSYGGMLARLRNVVVDPKLAEGRKGGEAIEEVLNQREEDEYLDLRKGYFSLKCNSDPKAGFGFKDHLSTWSRAVQCSTESKPVTARMRGMTLAVMRYEYVNLYHTMTDYYNAFLVMLMFDKRPNNVTILWVDSHPKGGLDTTWDVLFGDVKRAGHLKGPTKFDDMVWSVMGYNSPLNDHSRPFVPYLEEFREFFLSRHRIKTTKALNCDKLNIVFLWRRDYVAHPRNPKGLVKRKIANEDELFNQAREILPLHNITGVQLDILSMQQQLALVANTDILLGMHGAGLSHTLFLPRHSGLIEFYPIYWTQANRHFRAMASWRGLKYQTWQNHISENEKENYFTYIPPETMKEMLLEVKGKVCGLHR